MVKNMSKTKKIQLEPHKLVRVAQVVWLEDNKMRVVEMNFPLDIDIETIYYNVIHHLKDDYSRIITEKNIRIGVQNAETTN